MILLVLGLLIGATSFDGAGGTPPGTAADSLRAPIGEAVAGADTSLRVPGTWLRFGFTQEQVLAREALVVVPSPGQREVVTRRGNMRWFGVDTEASLAFLHGGLARARFVAKDVAPHALDYVEDQLAERGYRRRCEKLGPALRECEWTGPTLVKLHRQPRALTADVEPYHAPPAAPPLHAIARPRLEPVAAAPETVAVWPEVLRLSPGAGGPGLSAPELVDAAPLHPEYPRAARDVGVQGRVWVRALVDTSGTVMEVQVTRSIAELDSVALAGVRGLRFKPYRADGRPLRFRIDIPITFTLH